MVGSCPAGALRYERPSPWLSSAVLGFAAWIRLSSTIVHYLRLLPRADLRDMEIGRASLAGPRWRIGSRSGRDPNPQPGCAAQRQEHAALDPQSIPQPAPPLPARKVWWSRLIRRQKAEQGTGPKPIAA